VNATSICFATISSRSKSSLSNAFILNEFNLFIYDCQSRGLNPLKNEIYFVKRLVWDSQQQAKVGVATHQVSIDGLRIIAQRSGEYRGQTQVEYGATVLFNEVNVPEYAEVGIYREGFTHPVYARAYFAEYAQVYKGKDKQEYMGNMWAKMPRHMIQKCAEALALRKTFPDFLGNLYSEDEMSQADILPQQTTPEEVKELQSCQQCKAPVDVKTAKMSQKVLGDGKIFCSQHQTQIHNPKPKNE